MEDLSLFCRVCLQHPKESDLLDLNLIYDEEDQLTYSDCFTVCTQIDISEGEGLPHNLCRSCGLELQMAYDFYRKVEESKRVLMQLQSQEPETEVAAVEEIDVETKAASSQNFEEIDQEVNEEEERLDMEEYQSIEQLDEEELDFKVEVCAKEEEEEEFLLEYIDEVYSSKQPTEDHTISGNMNESECRGADIKKQMVELEKLSESENGVGDDITDLYKKVIDDVKIDHTDDVDESKATKNLELKPRRRGRPPLNKPLNSNSEDEIRLEDRNSSLWSKSSRAAVKRRRTRISSRAKKGEDASPIVCDICFMVCKSRSLLNSHRFRKHRPPRVVEQCPKCGRIFSSHAALLKHLKRTTCEVYPQFECEHCGKKFTGQSNYDIHMRFHKRQYPFVCHLCGKKFMLRVHLNEHILVKHENKRYPCQHPGCGKQFQNRSSLYNHAYQHTGYLPFSCAYCCRGYANKSRLRFHCRKSHGIDHTIEELGRMQIVERLPNTVVKAQ